MLADSEDDEEKTGTTENEQNSDKPPQTNTTSPKDSSPEEGGFDPAAFLKQMKEKSLRDMKSGGSSGTAIASPKTVIKKEVYEFAGEKVVYRFFFFFLTLLVSRKRCKLLRLLRPMLKQS